MILFRVDEYDNGFSGNLIGFYESKRDAKSNCEYNTPCNFFDLDTISPFSQITEFKVSDELDFDIKDTNKVLSKGIWGNSIIIKNYYYV